MLLGPAPARKPANTTRRPSVTSMLSHCLTSIETALNKRPPKQQLLIDCRFNAGPTLVQRRFFRTIAHTITLQIRDASPISF